MRCDANLLNNSLFAKQPRTKIYSNQFSKKRRPSIIYRQKNRATKRLSKRNVHNRGDKLNPAPFSDSELLAIFEEKLYFLNNNFYSEKTILEFNQICEEITNRKWTIKEANK